MAESPRIDRLRISLWSSLNLPEKSNEGVKALKLVLSLTAPDGSTITSRQEFKDGSGVPIPEVNDGFFINSMSSRVIVSQRHFIYEPNGDLEVVLIPK
jgi:hypothetical protein